MITIHHIKAKPNCEDRKNNPLTSEGSAASNAEEVAKPVKSGVFSHESTGTMPKATSEHAMIYM
eukprot:scaffold274847_cov18-Tisochrysis_lutea.AAC.1